MLGDEVQRLAELESQYGLTKNAGAVMKEAGVPGGLKLYFYSTLCCTCWWNGWYGNTYRLRSV